MMKRIFKVWTLPALVAPFAAQAQTISVVPLSSVSAPIPVDNLWALIVLSLSVAVASRWVLKKGQGKALLTLCSSAVLGAAMWHSPDLRAQFSFAFNNPAGESRPINVAPLRDGSQITGFAQQFFSNDSGVALLISRMELPTSQQCFPFGINHQLLKNDAPTSSQMLCQEGSALALGASCRVDVDAICRQYAAELLDLQSSSPARPTVPSPSQTLASSTIRIDRSSVAFPVGEYANVSVTNTGTVVARGIAPSVTAANGVRIANNTCLPSLAAGATCNIRFASDTQGGPYALRIAGQNTPSQVLQLTVTEAPAQQMSSTTLKVLSAALEVDANQIGTVSIANSGSAAAQSVVPFIPQGSGLVLMGNTCLPKLQPGASCTMSFLAKSAEGPTAVRIAGLNTAGTYSVHVTVKGPTVSIQDVGAFRLDGRCDGLVGAGAGFRLTAGTQPLPVGTEILVNGSGVASLGVMDVQGGVANVTGQGATSRKIVLAQAVPVGSFITVRTKLVQDKPFVLSGLVSLPSGFSGSGSKGAGQVSVTPDSCSAN